MEITAGAGGGGVPWGFGQLLVYGGESTGKEEDAGGISKSAAVQASGERAGKEGLSVKLLAAGTCNPILLSSSFLNPSFKTRKPEGLQTLGWFYWSQQARLFLPSWCVFGGGVSYFCARLNSPTVAATVGFASSLPRDRPGLRS